MASRPMNMNYFSLHWQNGRFADSTSENSSWSCLDCILCCASGTRRRSRSRVPSSTCLPFGLARVLDILSDRKLTLLGSHGKQPTHSCLAILGTSRLSAACTSPTFLEGHCPKALSSSERAQHEWVASPTGSSRCARPCAGSTASRPLSS